MKPLQYKNLYKHLRVDLFQHMSTAEATCEGYSRTYKIDQYLSGMSDNVEKNKLNSILRRNGYSDTDRYAVARAFNGKASVSQCQRVVVALIELQITNDIQSYCDRYLGLDCSGFVNNYFMTAHGLSERTIQSYYQRGRRHLRTEFNEFRNKDVLIWCSHDGDINSGRGSAQHIAIIEKITEVDDNELRAKVIESTGTVGLVDSVYTFVKTSEQGVYRVHRPLKPSNRNHVKVVPVLP